MESRVNFDGVGVALVTPFREGVVDRVALSRLASHLVESGVRALYPCGCTGEATSLTREERATVIATVVEAARGRASILAGTGTAHTGEALAQQKHKFSFKPPNGTTKFTQTHQLEVGERLATRVAVLRDGEIVEERASRGREA